MITLQVQPGTPPMKWEKFTKTMCPRSIALDGFVSTGPRFKQTGPYANFNHHEEVSRLETRATCAQVLLAVRSGLFKTFVNDKGSADATLFVNDCDEDVSLSVFILRNSHLATDTMNPRLNKLVFMEDMLDTTAGAYPFPKDMKTLQQLMWVFAPYHRFRMTGGLETRDPVAFKDVIDTVGQRIMIYITGDPETIELDTRFEKLGGGRGWSLVSEQGQNARIGVYDAGINAFVSVKERKDGNWNYSIGRCSQFIPFPIPVFLKELNRRENLAREKGFDDMWGGSDIIAGSPRINGSVLSPPTVSDIIEEILS
jgi:hypothetical protein